MLLKYRYTANLSESAERIILWMVSCTLKDDEELGEG